MLDLAQEWVRLAELSERNQQRRLALPREGFGVHVSRWERERSGATGRLALVWICSSTDTRARRVPRLRENHISWNTPRPAPARA